MDEAGRYLTGIQDPAVEALILPGSNENSPGIDILRLDKVHPTISGNKWFKLKYYLQDAREKHVNTILTFGGAWSNHIIAAASVSRALGLRSVGIIRGEQPLLLSSTLIAAMDHGMTLEFISRQAYSQKNDNSFIAGLQDRFGDVYVIPEGGAGQLGIEGSKEILSFTEKDKYSHIICCIGTGTMFSGLVDWCQPTQQVIGIPVLKGMENMQKHRAQDALTTGRYKIMVDYHFGGYAKKTPGLIEFMNHFYYHTGIPTDFVYTGKLMFALSDLVAKNYFPAGSKILVIHSGGLQGNASLTPGTLIF